jgi:hypothetical protein
VKPSLFELQATIKLHRQDLLGEAEREHLLARRPAQGTRVEQLLARTGRLLIAIGTRLESRYATAARAASTSGSPSIP